MQKILITSLTILTVLVTSCKKESTSALQTASYLYFAAIRDSSIGKIDLKNGNTVASFAKGIAAGITFEQPTALALNTRNGDIYSSSFINPGIIYRINSSGVISTLYSGAFAARPTAIGYDSTNNKVYWTNRTGGTVVSVNADGSGSPVALYGGAAVNEDGIGLAIDGVHRKIFFTANGSDIAVGNLNGTGTPSNLYSYRADTIISPAAYALDISNNKIYWTDELANVVACANLDGTGNFKILYNIATQGVDRPDGIALDLVARKIYWSETGTTKRIRVSNIDGTGTPATLASGVETYSLLLK